MRYKKKILNVNTAFSKGGAAQVARMLHNGLNKTFEFSSYFAYGRGAGPADKKAFRFAYQLEICLHTFLTRTTGLQGYGSYLSTRRLEKFILKEKFDLIHLHNLHGYYLNLSFVRFLGKLNIPIVWTLHDGWAITGRCAYFFECNHWKKGCGNCTHLTWYPKTYFDSSALMWKKKKEYFTSEWNPVIVCPSQWLADKVKESYLNRFKIEVIPNGVDTEVFKPKDKIEIRKKLRISSDKKVILFVAANLKDERKGVEFFLKALSHIKADNWIVLMIGKKINFNQEARIAGNIKQLDYVSDKNLISDIYNAADVFCITSLDEVFGLTVTESMACAIPVVGFKIGGIPEQVTDNCGILVSPKNIQNLAEAMEALLKDDEKRRAFGINCRKRVLENYSIEKFTERYINLYKNLLK